MNCEISRHIFWLFICGFFIVILTSFALTDLRQKNSKKISITTTITNVIPMTNIAGYMTTTSTMISDNIEQDDNLSKPLIPIFNNDIYINTFINTIGSFGYSPNSNFNQTPYISPYTAGEILSGAGSGMLEKLKPCDIIYILIIWISISKFYDVFKKLFKIKE